MTYANGKSFREDTQDMLIAAWFSVSQNDKRVAPAWLGAAIRGTLISTTGCFRLWSRRADAQDIIKPERETPGF